MQPIRLFLPPKQQFIEVSIQSESFLNVVDVTMSTVVCIREDNTLLAL